MRAEYEVLQDYAVPRLNGKDGVVWTEGSTVELDEDDAAWVNRDREGTLADVDAPADDQAEGDEGSTVELDETATTPADEQVGGKPPRSRGRSRDSAS